MWHLLKDSTREVEIVVVLRGAGIILFCGPEVDQCHIPWLWRRSEAVQQNDELCTAPSATAMLPEQHFSCGARKGQGLQIFQYGKVEDVIGSLGAEVLQQWAQD